MRFVVGQDLHALVSREGGLPARRAAAFISPVASALDAAHEAGLVHRDVKPANILVDARPGWPEHVYLSDFGVARHLRSVGSVTVPGQFLGTPDYAAPEQASGQHVDGRADQYALACVAYELLSGSVPFRRDEPMLVLYARLRHTAGADGGAPRPARRRRRGRWNGRWTSYRNAATTVAATSPTRCGKPSASSPTTRAAPSPRPRLPRCSPSSPTPPTASRPRP